MLSIVLSMMLAQPGPAARPLAADLIGYGRVELAANRDLVFTCEDSRHADQLLSKLRADFTWDSLLGPRPNRLPDGTPGIVLDDGQILVFASQENRVVVVRGTSPAEVQAELARQGFYRRKVHHVPEKRHPLALDFFDLRSVSLYFHPMNILNLAKGLMRYDRAMLARPADFWLAVPFRLQPVRALFRLRRAGHAAPHFFPMDYSLATAKAHDMVFMTHTGDYLAPWWMRNRFPRDIVQWDPYAISGWNGLRPWRPRISASMPPTQAYAYARAILRGTPSSMLKATAGDQLGCFREAGRRPSGRRIGPAPRQHRVHGLRRGRAAGLPPLAAGRPAGWISPRWASAGTAIPAATDPGTK